MSQHTESPWKARSAGQFIEGKPGHEKRRYYPAHVVAITTEEGRRVTRFICECSGVGLPNDANAQLIAASPELLEACKHMLDFCPPGLLADLKAAIQKAEGNS